MQTFHKRFRDFARCAEEAPEGSYVREKALREFIGDTADQLIRGARALGYQVDTCDGIYEVEAAIYNWVLNANPDDSGLLVAEGFGAAMDGPAAERVKAQAVRDVQFFASRI